MRFSLLFVLLTLSKPAFSIELVKRHQTCGFGLFAWCFWETPKTDEESTPWRSEVFVGAKPGMRYYEKEEQSCRQGQSCDFDAQGEVIGADLYRNVSGNNRSSDYVDLGLQYSQVPVASWRSEEGFTGSLQNAVRAGEGSLKYHFVRVAVKRSQFLYFIHSKYLISSFGVGIGIPEARSGGKDFVGADRIVPSLGGKLGFQFPLTNSVDVGLASNWNVLWYGTRMADSAFIAGYGLNISARI